jgi:phosphoglycerate dehydrogenase-like enzyme
MTISSASYLPLKYGGVARIALAFGMRVTAYSQDLTVERAAEHGATSPPLDDLLEGADVVSIHLVLSERTREALEDIVAFRANQPIRLL